MKFLNQIALLALLMVTASLNGAAAIKTGSSHIKIDYSSLSDQTADDLTAKIIYTNIFDEPLSANVLTLNRQENSLVGEIPMELSKLIAGLRFDRDSTCLAVGFLELIQGDTLYMQIVEEGNGLRAIEVNPQTWINSLWMTDKVGEDENFASSISGEFMTFLDPCMYSSTVKKEDFDNWEMLAYKQIVHYNSMLSQSLDNKEIADSCFRKLLENNLYLGFISRRVLGNKMDAKNFYDKTVMDFPNDYYSAFLSELDLNGNSFFRFPAQGYTPYYFSYQLLERYPDLKIKDDETITDWRTRVTPVIEQLELEADSEFYDFLVATCYVRNIRESKLLNDFQINQLKENVCEGLYEIVMNENSLMQQSLKGYNAKDLTSLESFDLEAYIKELNLGKPVVVDFWNTWCYPCLSARKQIDKLEDENPELFEKVEILYLSDESSPLDNWEKVSKQFGKTHLRLSKSAMEKIMTGYGFTAIPTYLFFDKDGKLRYSTTGFPGEAKFIEELKKITSTNP